jgi:hypothetical protein
MIMKNNKATDIYKMCIHIKCHPTANTREGSLLRNDEILFLPHNVTNLEFQRR